MASELRNAVHREKDKVVESIAKFASICFLLMEWCMKTRGFIIVMCLNHNLKTPARGGGCEQTHTMSVKASFKIL